MITTGIWTNENGSRVELTVEGTAVSGCYVSAKGKVDGETAHPVTGWTDGQVISFTVLWRGADSALSSTTAWSGRYIPAADAIDCLWIIATAHNGTRPLEPWEAHQINRSRFVRV